MGTNIKLKVDIKSGNPRRGENIDSQYVWQIQVKIFTLIKNIINTIVCVVSRWKSGSTIIQVDAGEEKAEASVLLSLPLVPLSASPHWFMQKLPSLFYIFKNTLWSSRENFKSQISHFRFKFTSKKGSSQRLNYLNQRRSPYALLELSYHFRYSTPNFAFLSWVLMIPSKNGSRQKLNHPKLEEVNHVLGYSECYR